jgi:Na+/proline symporter
MCNFLSASCVICVSSLIIGGFILKKVGIFLVLAGMLCIMAFVLYTVILDPSIPLLIKFGVTAAILGLFIIIAVLLLESIKKAKRRNEDDLSKY